MTTAQPIAAGEPILKGGGEDMMLSNPMFSQADRLEMASGAIKWRDAVIANLQQQLAALTSAPAQPEPPKCRNCGSTSAMACNGMGCFALEGEPAPLADAGKEELLLLLCSIADNLGDMPISDEWAAKTVTRVVAMVNALTELLRATPPTITDAQCDAIRAEERERIADLWAGCTTEATGHGLVDIGASIRAGQLVDATE